MKIARGRLALCLLFICFGVVYGETFVSTDVPKPIPDGPSGIVNSYLQITTSRVVLDLNITVTITHPFVGDLRLYLEGPNEEVVRLSNRVGQSGDNYTNTCFDDEATTPIENGDPPYTGCFEPDMPLYVFDGISSHGMWNFRVTDNASGDVGAIQAWQLDITLGDTVSAVDDEFIPNPSSFTLSAYPNPFNPATTITFSLSRNSDIQLGVFDVAGRFVQELASRRHEAGTHTVMFNASDLATGVYFARLQAGGVVKTRKLLLMK